MSRHNHLATVIILIVLSRTSICSRTFQYHEYSCRTVLDGDPTIRSTDKSILPLFWSVGCSDPHSGIPFVLVRYFDLLSTVSLQLSRSVYSPGLMVNASFRFHAE
jgi:hypothetical protein